jgi:hypothetical protein
MGVFEVVCGAGSSVFLLALALCARQCDNRLELKTGFAGGYAGLRVFVSVVLCRKVRVDGQT